MVDNRAHWMSGFQSTLKNRVRSATNRSLPIALTYDAVSYIGVATAQHWDRKHGMPHTVIKRCKCSTADE